MIVAAIPARSGSKGIEDKNICHVGGIPLLAWSIKTALDIKTIDRVIVSTDSYLYAAIARTYGVEVPWMRPPEFAKDDSDDYGWIKHMIDSGEYFEPHYLIVHLRPTTPLRDPEVILAGLAHFKAHPEATSMRSVEEMSESAWKCFEVDADTGFLYPLTENSGIPQEAPILLDYLLNPNLPRQRYPKTYHPNGYIDILRVSYILEHTELYGDKILAFETPRITEVDCEEDLERVRWEAERGPK